MSDLLSVQYKETKLRQKPSFLGKIVVTLSYGDKVSVLEEKGPWKKVKHSKGSGWLHKSSVTKKEIVLNAGSEDVKKAASDDELVLAGKGFSEQVENAYRDKNPKINFEWIDRMESHQVDPSSLEKFIKDGGLV